MDCPDLSSIFSPPKIPPAQASTSKHPLDAASQPPSSSIDDSVISTNQPERENLKRKLNTHPVPASQFRPSHTRSRNPFFADDGPTKPSKPVFRVVRKPSALPPSLETAKRSESSSRNNQKDEIKQPSATSTLAFSAGEWSTLDTQAFRDLSSSSSIPSRFGAGEGTANRHSIPGTSSSAKVIYPDSKDGPLSECGGKSEGPPRTPSPEHEVSTSLGIEDEDDDENEFTLPLSSKLHFITMEDGFSDRLINQLEENYVNHRDRMMTSCGELMTPLKFLRIICDRMKVEIQQERFAFRDSNGTVQCRVEMYVAGFCGVSHALQSNFASQLAAAHILERMKIYFGITGHNNSYALFPGCRYTKIKDKLDALCRNYSMGEVCYKVATKTLEGASENVVPSYECTCIVQNLRSSAISDSLAQANCLAARDMYVYLVKPGAVLIQIKDYFSIGAECPMLKDIYHGPLGQITSENKIRWMQKFGIVCTDPCLHDPSNESRHLLLWDVNEMNTSPAGNVTKTALVQAFEWIDRKMQLKQTPRKEGEGKTTELANDGGNQDNKKKRVTSGGDTDVDLEEGEIDEDDSTYASSSSD